MYPSPRGANHRCPQHRLRDRAPAAATDNRAIAVILPAAVAVVLATGTAASANVAEKKRGPDPYAERVPSSTLLFLSVPQQLRQVVGPDAAPVGGGIDAQTGRSGPDLQSGRGGQV